MATKSRPWYWPLQAALSRSASWARAVFAWIHSESSPPFWPHFSFAFYNVGGHTVLARYDRWKVLLWVLVGTSAFWLIVNPPWKIVAAHYGRQQWAFMAIFSVVSVLVPFSCYFAGLQHLEPTRAIVASCLEPVFSIVLAAVFLGELLRPVQTLGIVLVLIAIVLIQMPERAARGEDLLVEPME